MNNFYGNGYNMNYPTNNRFDFQKNKKKIIIISSIVVVLAVAIFFGRPYIRILRTVFIAKDMFNNLEFDGEYQITDFIESQQKAKDIIAKLGITVDKGKLKGEMHDYQFHGFAYANDTNEEVTDFYLLPEDITVNLRQFAKIARQKGGILGLILKIIPIDDKEYVSLKKMKILDEDFKFAIPEEEVKKIIKEAVKKFRNAKMPEDTEFKDKIKDFDFYKTVVNGVDIVAGLPKKIDKKKVCIYARATIDNKDAELLANFSKK